MNYEDYERDALKEKAEIYEQQYNEIMNMQWEWEEHQKKVAKINVIIEKPNENQSDAKQIHRIIEEGV